MCGCKYGDRFVITTLLTFSHSTALGGPSPLPPNQVVDLLTDSARRLIAEAGKVRKGTKPAKAPRRFMALPLEFELCGCMVHGSRADESANPDA